MFSRLYVQFVLGAAVLAGGAFAWAALLVAGSAALAMPVFWSGLVMVLAVTAGLSHFAARRLTQAIAELRREAESLARSEFRPRVAGNHATEIVAASTALQESAASIADQRRRQQDEISRLSTVLQSMADGVLAVDDRYQILLANAACHQMLKLSTTDVVGRPLLEVTRLRALYDAVGQVLSRPGSLTLDLSVGDKSPQHFLLRAAQLPGEPCPGVVVVLHDVTEVRRLENIRKEFVANVSHELKTPLASIMAYAETLRLGAINDPDHNLSFISRIEDDAKRLNGLIADMLQIARIESHQQAFKLRPVDIEPQVNRCVRDMTARAQGKGIDLRVDAPDRPLMVIADEEGLQTILANLVDNAIKYTAPGGSVTVRWNEEADSVILAVEDTGMGIEPQFQDRIFERFFRVDRARTRDAGGTGLGLSIVKHLVQAFDGSVSVQSQLGVGSCFLVRLPPARL